MADKEREDRLFHTAGWGRNEELYFFPGPVSCGAIVDGVAFRHGGGGDWVVSYSDLIEMARLATDARKDD